MLTNRKRGARKQKLTIDTQEPKAKTLIQRNQAALLEQDE
jgi:hypothetical protein